MGRRVDLTHLPHAFPVSPLEHDVAAARAAGTLTELETGVLDLEASAGWWKYAGAKEQTIRDRLGCSPTRHYQVLGALLQNDTAHRAYPHLVARLRRLRDQRAGQRSPRRST